MNYQEQLRSLQSEYQNKMKELQEQMRIEQNNLIQQMRGGAPSVDTKSATAPTATSTSTAVPVPMQQLGVLGDIKGGIDKLISLFEDRFPAQPKESTEVAAPVQEVVKQETVNVEPQKVKEDEKSKK